MRLREPFYQPYFSASSFDLNLKYFNPYLVFPARTVPSALYLEYQPAEPIYRSKRSLADSRKPPSLMLLTSVRNRRLGIWLASVPPSCLDWWAQSLESSSWAKESLSMTEFLFSNQPSALFRLSNIDWRGSRQWESNKSHRSNQHIYKLNLMFCRMTGRERVADLFFSSEGVSISFSRSIKRFSSCILTSIALWILGPISISAGIRKVVYGMDKDFLLSYYTT